MNDVSCSGHLFSDSVRVHGACPDQDLGESMAGFEARIFIIA